MNLIIPFLLVSVTLIAAIILSVMKRHNNLARRVSEMQEEIDNLRYQLLG